MQMIRNEGFVNAKPLIQVGIAFIFIGIVAFTYHGGADISREQTGQIWTVQAGADAMKTLALSPLCPAWCWGRSRLGCGWNPQVSVTPTLAGLAVNLLKTDFAHFPTPGQAWSHGSFVQRVDEAALVERFR